MVQRNETGGYLGRKLGKVQKSSASSGILGFRISKILGFIGGFALSAAVRVSGRVERKATGAKPPFGRSVAGIEKSVPGVRASIAGFVKTGRTDVCP